MLWNAQLCYLEEGLFVSLFVQSLPLVTMSPRVFTDLESPGIEEVRETFGNGGQGKIAVAVVSQLDFYFGLFGLDFSYLFCYFKWKVLAYTCSNHNGYGAH